MHIVHCVTFHLNCIENGNRYKGYRISPVGSINKGDLTRLAQCIEAQLQEEGKGEGELKRNLEFKRGGYMNISEERGRKIMKDEDRGKERKTWGDRKEKGKI